MSETMAQGPLAGLRIAELAQGASGPFCAMQLADLGADVIKIEPLDGDRTRRIGPPGCDAPSELFLWLNRNKRSIAVEIETEAGQEIVRRLAATADVFLEDLGPGRAEEFGIGYDTLSVLNDRLVYAAISSFGEEGPLKDRSGTELVIQAMADYPGSLGVLDAPPVRLGTDVAQMNTAISVFQAIMAALLQRARTQKGERVSVSMLGTLLHNRGMMWTALSNPDEWVGFYNDGYLMPPAHGYQTKDTPIYISLGRGTSEDWDQLLVELDMLDVVTDERFDGFGRNAVGVGRYAHETLSRWEEAFKEKTAAEVIEIITRRGGNAVPMNDYASLCRNPQVAELRLITNVPLEDGGSIQAVASPWEFSETEPRNVHSAPPRLGQHTAEVLAELGYRPDEIARLTGGGVSKTYRTGE